MLKILDQANNMKNVCKNLGKWLLLLYEPIGKVWVLSNIEALVQRCSVKMVFLEISQNPQENTCARVSFLIKPQVWVLQLY